MRHFVATGWYHGRCTFRPVAEEVGAVSPSMDGDREVDGEDYETKSGGWSVEVTKPL